MVTIQRMTNEECSKCQISLKFPLRSLVHKLHSGRGNPVGVSPSLLESLWGMRKVFERHSLSLAEGRLGRIWGLMGSEEMELGAFQTYFCLSEQNGF